MSFTNKQVYDLNNMNVAAQNVQLGTLLSSMESGKLDLSGGTMTGALTLAGAPVNDLEAATKKYVDDNAGGGGDVVKVIYDSDTMSVEDLGVAVKAICYAGKIPAIVEYGTIYYCHQSSEEEEEDFFGAFHNWVSFLADGVLVSLGVETLLLTYTESEGWALERASKQLIGTGD